MNYNITHECIKEVSNIGHTIFYNICDGTTEIVPWGVLDWISRCLALITLIGITIAVVTIMYILLSPFNNKNNK